jgi:hypothetical protein
MFITEQLPACHGARAAGNAETVLKPPFGEMSGRKQDVVFSPREGVFLYPVDSSGGALSGISKNPTYRFWHIGAKPGNEKFQQRNPVKNNPGR